MDLKELLGEELFTQVTEKLGKHKNIELLVNDKKENSYVPKSRLDTVIKQKGALSDKVDELEVQLEEMRTGEADIESLKAQLQDAQTKIADAKAESTKIRKDSEIKLAIAGSGAKKSDLITKLLDADKVVIKEDGTVEGLEEQITALKEEAPELFGVINTQPQGGTAGKPARGSGEGSDGDDGEEASQNPGGTGNPGKGGNGRKGKVETIGERIAKRRVATHSPEVDFFK